MSSNTGEKLCLYTHNFSPVNGKSEKLTGRASVCQNVLYAGLVFADDLEVGMNAHEGIPI